VYDIYQRMVLFSQLDPTPPTPGAPIPPKP
jgi:hypothetical protein